MAAAVREVPLLCYCLTFAMPHSTEAAVSLQTLPTEGEVTAHPIISGLEMQGGWFLLVVKTFTKRLCSCRAKAGGRSVRSLSNPACHPCTTRASCQHTATCLPVTGNRRTPVQGSKDDRRGELCKAELNSEGMGGVTGKETCRLVTRGHMLVIFISLSPLSLKELKDMNSLAGWQDVLGKHVFFRLQLL